MIKTPETVTANPPISTYLDKIENKITFKIKTWILSRTFNA